MYNKMKAILVAISLKYDSYDLKYSLDELNNLAVGLGYTVCNTLTQNLEKPTARFYIGSGKVEELKTLIAYHEVNTVIFNDELSPSQLRNLEKELNVEIIDRTLLILRIFDQRANTKEARLETKLAMNKYLLPRDISLWREDSREGGSSGAQSSKGAGETKRELNKRYLASEISRLEKELAQMHKIKLAQIENRKKKRLPIVALVGYTNAGKSSTMNTIIKELGKDKEVYAENKLFATLNTYNRLLTYKNIDFILVDTIGFVSKLPHHLINSFKGTLQEIKNADFILHIVDVSSRYFIEQINVTNEVLQSIGVKDIPMLYVLNKYDLYDDQNTQIVGIENLPYSNKTKLNLDLLLKKIYAHIKPVTLQSSFLIPYSEAKLLHTIEEEAQIVKKEYKDDFVYYELILNIDLFKKLEIYEQTDII